MGQTQFLPFFLFEKSKHRFIKKHENMCNRVGNGKATANKSVGTHHVLWYQKYLWGCPKEQLCFTYLFWPFVSHVTSFKVYVNCHTFGWNKLRLNDLSCIYGKKIQPFWHMNRSKRIASNGDSIDFHVFMNKGWCIFRYINPE